MSPKPSKSDEFTRFENALEQVLKVSKTDLNRMLTEEKSANAGKPRRGPRPGSKRHHSTSASGHASPDKG
jgi:hypothetical protein